MNSNATWNGIGVCGGFYNKKISTTSAQVIKENLVKLDRLPLVTRVPSLPEMFLETHVELEILRVDLLDLSVNARFIKKLEE